ncbi:hypothetical protein OIU84_026975 [Salix udensis]|uniref:Uncharacterized protein n=1 Tax=Salix udensis TaxID=889485 RepID=A0AAD6PAB5_9ROSI|nr:hypothetical protein OIU84_026975 [Salix udensis]
MKRKTEEMKVKIYSLRTQKMEVDRRQLEMQSTIDSIKDEQKIMESSLEEKQNEIKMLREMNIDAEKGNLQMADLIESLKQKEAEIENLKHHLENPAKKWSVSTDDPSSPPHKHDSNDGNGLDPTRGNGVNSTSTDLEMQGDSAIVENASESKRQLSAELKEHQKTADAHNDEKSRDREDHKLENVRGAEDHQENFRGGVKSEMVGKSRSRGAGRGTTVLAELIYREEGRTSIDGKTEEITKAVGSSEAKSMEHQNHEDSKNLENKLGEDQTNQQMSEDHETIEKAPSN